MTDAGAQPTPFSEVGAPPVTAAAVTLLSGSSFCVSDPNGDIDGDRAQGLFVRDTRLLSRWRLGVDGWTPGPLAAQQPRPFAAVFVGRGRPKAGEADSALVVVRRRRISDGLREDITLSNYAERPADVLVELALEADLADLFEVKEGRAAPAPSSREWPAPGSVRIGRGRHCVQVDSEPAGQPTPAGLSWLATVPARGSWSVRIQVAPVVDGLVLPVAEEIGENLAGRRLADWRARGPRVETPDPALAGILRQTHQDLGILRIFAESGPADRAVVAAGAPWFMALFGRDSLLTSWMSLPVDGRLAIDTLHTLAEHQGVRVDRESEEEPGRIPHEVRFGPSAPLAFGERNAYYGTADATPLFVALFGELRRWGHDGPAVRALLPAVDRALSWLTGYGDPDGDGFVEYARKTPAGLVNQGWKDSWDGVNFADGRPAEAPIALAEVQAYTYAAFVARAEFARDVGDTAGEQAWRGRAEQLKAAFNAAFWLPDRGWYAIGLDRDKRPIDALTSNVGHCLWTGIADADKAARVAEHLASADMFTGWGIRTLAGSMAAYNPVGYHNGTVWPHDTAIGIAGLMRYGHVRTAQRLAAGLVEAARRFGGRLPELYCGFPRAEFPDPVAYPTSCSPQAWSAAAPLLVLRALMRFDPELTRGRIWCAPAVPGHYLPLTIRDVPLGTRTATITVDVDGAHVDGAADVELRAVPRTP